MSINIAVVGTGHVGLSIAILLAQHRKYRTEIKNCNAHGDNKSDRKRYRLLIMCWTAF